MQRRKKERTRARARKQTNHLRFAIVKKERGSVNIKIFRVQRDRCRDLGDMDMNIHFAFEFKGLQIRLKVEIIVLRNNIVRKHNTISRFHGGGGGSHA